MNAPGTMVPEHDAEHYLQRTPKTVQEMTFPQKKSWVGLPG
jgi:hypothetical protein